MADAATRRFYEGRGEEWVARRRAAHRNLATWVEAHRQPGPVVDVGCGPGWHLDPVAPPRVGLDLARTMLAQARSRRQTPWLVQADAARLPFPPRSFGGAIASRVHTHLPRADNPMALAELHLALKPEAPVFFHLLGDRWGTEFRSEGEFGGRLFSGWSRSELHDLLTGAGFEIARLASTEEDDDHLVLARRAVTLPDTVGPAMRLLVCGLNPSVYSAEVGVGFGRPGNRFWPAAVAAGLVTEPFDPYHALRHHRVGMTDLVKRPTRRAAELSTDEYEQGLARVERLVRWLQPAAVCFVGLTGWRAVRNRTAEAGVQADNLGGRPVYLMPSTSGLNAHSTLTDLTVHLEEARALGVRS